jgi:hypothetical protein
VGEIVTAHEDWHFSGLQNLFWLSAVLGAVMLPKPLQDIILGGELSLPTIIMIASAVISYATTGAEIQEVNVFYFGPVKVVGYLFIGIFLSMIPALQLLEHGGVAGVSSPLSYFFASGTLSAFLASAMGQQSMSVDSAADVVSFSQHKEFT